jgi:CheY-like chemotaxis protein
MKILLLDDDTKDVPAIADVWRLLGHDVVQVTDSHGLVDAMARTSFDAVLLDLMIPAVDVPVSECDGGFTTGEYLYKTIISPKLTNVPFAVFSSAILDLEVIRNAHNSLRKYTNYRGFFEKGCADKTILEAISK